MADSVIEGVSDNGGVKNNDTAGKLYNESNDDKRDVSNGEASLSQPNATGEDSIIKGHGAVVAAHYNTIEEKGLDERNRSRIVHLRNFNNWIKSMLIDEYLKEIRDSKKFGSPLKALDMCCGKGGDLFKWRTGKITHLICADLAETSVKQCQKRYEDLETRVKNDKGQDQIFSAEFIAADCTKVRLREQYKDSSVALDLVSCQFSFHYSFESLAQAECILRNASECLQAGGYFIGTMPDANEIISRLEKCDGLSFGNDVYRISFDSKEKPFPLFGGKYDFHLEGVVDCPEFLVHFPTLEKLALKYGLEKVANEKFEEFYNRKRKRHYGRNLLSRMQALETYPPANDTKLIGNEETDYKHAKEHLKIYKNSQIGTLSTPEWEAATLYMVFAFRKMRKSVGPNDEVTYTPYVSKTTPRDREDRNQEDTGDDDGKPRDKYARRDEYSTSRT